MQNDFERIDRALEHLGQALDLLEPCADKRAASALIDYMLVLLETKRALIQSQAT